MGVSSDMRSSRVRRQAAKKPNKERTVQVRFSDEELAALDAICSEKKMTRSAFLRSCVEKVQGGDVEPTYVVTRNADAERMASEAKSIGVNVNQIARALNAETKSHPGSLSPAYFDKFLHADVNDPEIRDQVFEYFVDKVYLYDDKLVVSMWFSEDDKQEITWRDWFSLDEYWTDESPFVKGEAAEFDCFPLGSTNSYKQVEKCLYLLFYYLQIPRRIELYAGRER